MNMIKFSAAASIKKVEFSLKFTPRYLNHDLPSQNTKLHFDLKLPRGEEMEKDLYQLALVPVTASADL